MFGAFIAGVALGGVVFGLLIASCAWDRGYLAGRRDERGRNQNAADFWRQIKEGR